ncbi:MAG TPA: 50S ribosomal protein L9 [Longimicrobiales bacterium]|nr:50S ribosomal protein L9 [Longimicrobiales bacterium]
MKTVKVILRDDVAKLGDAGEIVSVKPGYARNYLLPQDLAYEATDASIRRLEQERERAEQQARRNFLEGRRRASQLEDVSLTFHARAGEESKLFGSITSADIADRLGEQDLDFEVDRKQIDLEEPIKALGVYNVPVKLHSDVTVEIKVWVIKEE